MTSFRQYEYFTLITQVAASGALTPTQACIAYAMGTMADNKSGELRWSRSSYASIADTSGRSTSSVKRTVALLVDLGLVEREARMIGASQRGWHLQLVSTLPEGVTLAPLKGVTPETLETHKGVTPDTLRGSRRHPSRGSRLTPHTNDSSNDLSNENNRAAEVGVVRDAQAPTRGAEPEPAAASDVSFDLVDDGIPERARALAVRLHRHMESEYAETGHYPSLVAPMLAACLRSGWSEERLRDEVRSQLPFVRARFTHKQKALSALLSDMSKPGYGEAPATPTTPVRSPDRRQNEPSAAASPTPPPPGCENLPPKPPGWTWYDHAGIHGVTLDHMRYRYA